MKKVFAVLAVVIPILVLAATVQYQHPATGVLTSAEVIKPGGNSDTGAIRTATKTVQVYDSGSVAAGAAIDSGVLDVSGATILSVYVAKGDTTSRNASITFYKADGTSVVYTSGQSACASTYCLYNYGISATGGTASVALALPSKFKFALAAGGAVAASIVINVH